MPRIDELRPGETIVYVSVAPDGTLYRGFAFLHRSERDARADVGHWHGKSWRELQGEGWTVRPAKVVIDG